ncbi:MAG: hypothetical protein IPJ71_02100 [Bdellovibrionales bacterium]|nr:hypothetical protein [Bdellovibrionales bacterium]
MAAIKWTAVAAVTGAPVAAVKWTAVAAVTRATRAAIATTLDYTLTD